MKIHPHPAVRVAAMETLEGRRLFHAPAIDVIPAQSVPIGKTLQLPVTASYDHSDALTYTVTDNSGSIVSQLRPRTNTWIEMDVAGFGTMKFELFNDIAPDTVRRITGLINAGYYNGLTFHRVIDDFIIQGGDPVGNGTGGPNFSFDDEFSAAATFTGDGQLAMANSGKDTNGSQFFITEGSQRFLDFNHTVFGQLVRGKAVRDAISELATDSNGAPQNAVTISAMRVVTNKSDAVLQLRLLAAASGTVTVTATGVEGTSSRSFTVTGVTDTDPNADTPPILTSLQPVYYTPAATPLTINFTSADLEGTAVEYGVQFATMADSQSGVDIAYVNSNTGIKITPPAGFTGPLKLYIGVKAAGATGRGSTNENANLPLSGIYDSQLITIAIGDKSVTAASVPLDAAATTTTNNVVVASFTDADTAGAASDWTASINWGDNVITTGTVVKTAAGKFNVVGAHTYTRAGQFPVTVDITGNKGAFARAGTGIATTRPVATLASTTVTVQGGSGNDVIGISKKGQKFNVNVNNVITQYDVSAVTRFDIYGYAGDDLLALGANVPGSYLFGDVGNDTLQGGDFNDTLTGAGGKNFMYGNAANDRINGSSGRDYAYGGLGDDRIYGGAGADYLEGNAGVDRIWGEDGDDLVVGGGSNDKLFGGLGTNTLVGGAGADILDGTGGADSADTDSADTRIAIEVLL